MVISEGSICLELNTLKRRVLSTRLIPFRPQASHKDTQLELHAVEKARRGPTSTTNENRPGSSSVFVFKSPEKKL
jgi:hypothetical protein